MVTKTVTTKWDGVALLPPVVLYSPDKERGATTVVTRARVDHQVG
jgi:hypothetical protein